MQNSFYKICSSFRHFEKMKYRRPAAYIIQNILCLIQFWSYVKMKFSTIIPLGKKWALRRQSFESLTSRMKLLLGASREYVAIRSLKNVYATSCSIIYSFEVMFFNVSVIHIESSAFFLTLVYDGNRSHEYYSFFINF